MISGGLCQALRATALLIAFGLPVCVCAQSPEATTLAAAQQERASGDLRASIKRLRQALIQYPDSYDLRLELGYALLLDRQFAAAQYHFELLLSRTEDLGRQALLRAVLARLTRERPFGIRLIFDYARSSNINLGSENSPLGVPDAVTSPQSGWVITWGARGFYRWRPNPNNALRLDLSLSQRRASDASVPLQNTYRASFAWDRATTWGRYGLAIGAMQRNGGEIRSTIDERLTQTWAQIAAQLRVSDRFRWNISLREAHNSFEIESDKSGPYLTGAIRATWLLPRSQTVWLGAKYEHNRPARTNQRFTGQAWQLGGRVVLRGGTLIEPVLTYGERDFSVARKDSFRQISVSVQDGRFNWRGLTPRLSCNWFENRSNNVIFEYDQHTCGINLTRRF